MNQNDITIFLANKWLDSGVNEGDVLLVHSSIKNLLLTLKKEFSQVASPLDVYNSLKLALGSTGTLILPLFNFDFPKVKFFDINKTPSQMGALTEIGRLDPQSIRTGHPIYSFSVTGAKASEFQDIDNISGYGSDSPFAKIKELGGKIAIIGLSDQHSMTSYHFVEEQNHVGYRYFKEFIGKYIDKNGLESEKTYKLYVRDLEKGVLTDVNRMMDHLWELNLYKGEKYNDGYGMRTIDFNDFYNATEKVIQDGLAIEYLYSLEAN
ncbi:MAG: AAC(3) family N-acetyltransferase [Saprospiraceae bacterium]|nr:AAC(3) family N-acetyltransferase [Candidatus Brachybacter algidus]MBL0120506.1 AAC(3) family N-acetyltransferase [Candidatus Brachybacter algidus]MBP7306767.1 AAC(3) family N-acetyltransferase [Saprospiraceae bacterium]HQW70945.1 AAC(3) family N-acetyltransferase [Saprospiraceae bacterium]